jgi:urease accessory protein
MSLAGLLLLTDSRLPAGGHAHSSGLEAAVHAGLVRDLDSLTSWLRGRLATGGQVAAAFAAAATRLAPGTPAAWADLDRELDARTPALAQRRASRAQGRSLLRAVTTQGAAMPGGAMPSGAMPGGAIATRGAATQSAATRGATAHSATAHSATTCGAATHGAATQGAAFAAMREGCGPAPHQPLVFGAAAATLDVTPRQVASGIALAAITGPASAAVRLLALDQLRVHTMLMSLTPDVERIAAEASVPRDVTRLPAAASPLLDILSEHHATQEGRLFAS